MSSSSEYLILTNTEKCYTTASFSGYYKKNPTLPNKTSHECRHTSISELQKLGIPLSKIKTIVRHSQKDITDGVYTHYDIKTLRNVIEMIKY